MKCRLLMALLLAGAACSTTTRVRSFTEPTAQRWFVERDHAAVTVAPIDRGSGQISIRIAAVSPTEIRFHASEGPIIPVLRAHRVTDVQRWRGAIDGLLIGAAVGAVASSLIAYSNYRSSDPPPVDCDTCTGEAVALIVGFPVIGMFTGLLTGAIIGHRDILEVR